MLHITPAMLECTYELLRVTPPFRRWGLPHADEVEFHVCKMKDAVADYIWWWSDGKMMLHRIRVSAQDHHKIFPLIESMAHEMCHMKQRLMNTNYASHGQVFKRLAAQVCRHHGFDKATF